MAGKFVSISLALKLRLLFGAAVLTIIAAALVVPWYFMELLAEQTVQQRGAELTRLALNAHLLEPPKNPAADNTVAVLHAAGGQADGRKGPVFIKLSADRKTDQPLDSYARKALKAFEISPGEDLAVFKTEDEEGRTVYRSFRAVRVETTCMRCHGPSAPPGLQYQPGQLVGIIDVGVPGQAAAGTLIWWTRGAFVVGVALATMLAIILFAVITQRLILRPVRQLRNVAVKAAEGDLSGRCNIKTGDELQHLGESFNDMLAAIADQTDKLRSANRALDLKLNELAEANVTLFQANKVKSEFLANVSHELRTPLNAIIGFADLLGESSDERIRRYGQNISSSAKSLLAMINDLLDLARIEVGKAEVYLDKVSLIDTCQTLASLMRPLADKKQLQLESRLADNLPIITTDAGKVQQILYNLLSNAIKFTPPGGKIALEAKLEASQRRQGRPAAIRREGDTEAIVREVAVAVSDTGPGIPEADQQRIFEKFFQADRSLTKESGGTGLGLAISRELTNLLGGRLTLKSSPGQGATFTLYLPVDAPAAPQAAVSA
jgi:signal transduction histidine kinase